MGGKELQMKMAKASKYDIATVHSFMQELELAIESRIYIKGDDEESDTSDERLLEFVQDRWEAVSTSWRRVVHGCEMLIDNCCDPDADTLEWRPDIEELMAVKHPRLIADWHEDIGNVLWWKFPVEEPPYCGTPLDSEWVEDVYTHWTPLVCPSDPEL